MALNLSQKKEVVAELANVAAKAHSLVAAEYAGLTVEQMTAMRKKARQGGVYVQGRQEHPGVPRCRRHGVRVRPGRARRSAAVRLLERRSRCCRSADQGFRQGQRQAEGKARRGGRQGCTRRRMSTCWPRCRPAIRRWHAAQRAGAARDHAGPRAFGARRADRAGATNAVGQQKQAAA